MSDNNNDFFSPLAPSLENVGITTNIITGKKADGSEVVELNAESERAKAFEWNEEDEVIKTPDKVVDEDGNPIIPGLPPLGKILVETVDGSKLYFITDGCYLDLRQYLKFSDFNPREYISRNELELYTPRTVFEEIIRKCISIEAFQRKFSEYYDSYEIDRMVNGLKQRVEQFPLDAYSKSEVLLLLDNIDKYTRAEVDNKIGKIMDLIIKNNNDWEKSIEDLVKIDFVRNELTGYLTKEEFSTFRTKLISQTDEFKNRLNNYITVTMYDRDMDSKVDKDYLENLKSELVTIATFNSTLDNYITNDELANSLSDKLTVSDLEERVKDFITITNVREEIINKVERSDLHNLEERINSKQGEIDTKFNNYVTNDQLNNNLSDYLTVTDFNREKISINELFRRYETIEKTDEKIQDLRNELNGSIRNFLTTSRYEEEKINFATNMLVTSEIVRLEGLINSKLDNDTLTNEINRVTNNLTTLMQNYLTGEEIDNKITSLRDVIDSKYSKAEVEQKLSVINQNIEDSINAVRNSTYSKSVLDSRFSTKVEESTFNNKLQDLKTELDLDNKLNTKLDKNTFNSTISEYTNTVTMNTLLSNKLEQSNLDSAISNLNNNYEEVVREVNVNINNLDNKVSTVENSLRLKINEEIGNREEQDILFNAEITNINDQLVNFATNDSVNDKLNNLKTNLESQVSVIETNINPKINNINVNINEIRESVNSKATPTDISAAKDDLLNVINEKELAFTQVIQNVDDKFSNYLTNENFNIEKTRFVSTDRILEIEDRIANDRNDLNSKNNELKNEVTALKSGKLDITTFDSYTQNVFSKAEVLERIIPANDVFRKQEINTLIDALKAAIEGNNTRISEISTEVNNRYSNQRIDSMVNTIRGLMIESNTGLSRRIDDKVALEDYNRVITKINTSLNNKVDLSTLTSAITTNNTKYKTAVDVDTQFETFRTVFWNDIILNFTKTADINKKFDLYTSLEYLKTELAKYTTLEKLEAKILDINSISRSDVVQMITNSKGEITGEYKRWINNLLASYTTTQALNTLLNDKVSVTEFNSKMLEVQNTYLSKEEFNREKDAFVTTSNIYGIIDTKVAALLESYYDKGEIDDLLNGIKNLIISNSNLFYSKDIMDEKLLMLETKSDASIKKSMIDNSIGEIRDKFNSYPTISDLEARLNAIGAYTAGISMDSFYNKTQMDGFLLLKADVDTLNTLDQNVYKKIEIDNTLENYVKKSNYTTALSTITDNLANTMRNPVLTLNKDDIIVTESLNDRLTAYQRKDNLPHVVTEIINPILNNYSNNEDLELKFTNFKATLTDLDGLINYIKKTDFENFKAKVYEKSYIDVIDNKFNDYTTTEILNTKLNAIKSTIKTDQEILNLVQSSGGRNYTKEEINNLLSQKYDTSEITPLLNRLDTKYDGKYITIANGDGKYLSKEDFSTQSLNFLHLTHGGTVAGGVTFEGGALIKSGRMENLDMQTTDISNVRNIDVRGLGTFINIKSIGETDLKNLSVENIASIRNLTIRKDGKLVIPITNVDVGKDFNLLNYNEYENISNNISLITKDNSTELILNLGLKSGNNLNNKFLRFNLDGSISTRTIRNNDFEGGWITSALKSDITTLENKINTDFIKATTFNTTLSNYYTKQNVDGLFSNYYNRPEVDDKIRILTNRVNSLSSNTTLMELINSKANNTDLSQLRLEFTQEKANRYSKTELNDIWKPQFMRELDEYFSQSFVTKGTFITKLGECVTNTTLQPILTQHGSDIMLNIQSNYVTLTTLHNKLKLHYNKEEIDSRIALLVSKSYLDNALESYTTTEDLNLIHRGFNTQIDTANKTALSSKVNLDNFKDVVSTNYYNKADTRTEISNTVNEAIKGFATKQELMSEKQALEIVIGNNKSSLELLVNQTKQTLEEKDTELGEKITANTNKFSEYVTTVNHNSSVVNERSISDEKYFTKLEAAGLIQKTYVDQQDSLKANKSGDTFTGRVQFDENIVVKGDSNVNKLISKNIITPKILNSDTRVIQNNNEIFNIDSENSTFQLVKEGSKGIGFILGNSLNKTSNESLGYYLGYDGTDLYYSKLTEYTIDSRKYFHTDVNKLLADKDYVNSELNKIKTVDIPDIKTNLEQKLNTELSRLADNSTITTMNEEIQGVKGSLDNYVKKEAFGEFYTPKETVLKQYITNNYVNKVDLSNYYTKEQVDGLINTLRGEIQSAVASFDTTELERRIMQAVDNKINEKLAPLETLLNKINGHNF